jgi:RNA polymerase sigma-70 factor, ECF subfamily
MDRELVERARSGDHLAFEQLAAAAVDRMFGVARLILRDADLAEDATQEALFRAWRDLPTLRDPDRWEAWLRRLLTRACMDQARKRPRLETHVRLLTVEPSMADASTALADRDQMARSLSRLPPDQRAALVLRYHLGLSVPEVAVTLGIPLGTAKSRLHHATEALRAAVDADARPSVREVTA